MRRHLTNALAFSLASIVIASSGFYARSMEARRNIDPQRIFRQINRDYFAGQLEDVPVKWETLIDAYGETTLDGDRAVSIQIDPQTNKTSEAVIETVRHEACHVFTGSAGNDHGPAFQDCINRYKAPY
jgi:SprT-like family protein